VPKSRRLDGVRVTGLVSFRGSGSIRWILARPRARTEMGEREEREPSAGRRGKATSVHRRQWDPVERHPTQHRT